MMSKIKGAYKSLTIWMNMLFGALMSNAETIMSGLRDNLPSVSQWLNADMLKYAALFIICVNVLLRFRTSKPLDQK